MTVDLTPGPGEYQERSGGPPDLDELVRELGGLLWRIEGNYNREGSGRGSRFEGETCESVQARALVRRVWPLAYRAGREDATKLAAEENGQPEQHLEALERAIKVLTSLLEMQRPK